MIACIAARSIIICLNGPIHHIHTIQYNEFISCLYIVSYFKNTIKNDCHSTGWLTMSEVAEDVFAY